MSLAEFIKKIDGNKTSIIINEKGLNPEYSGNNSRFISEFGDFDYTSHEQAISELYQWYGDVNNVALNLKDFT